MYKRQIHNRIRLLNKCILGVFVLYDLIFYSYFIVLVLNTGSKNLVEIRYQPSVWAISSDDLRGWIGMSCIYFRVCQVLLVTMRWIGKTKSPISAIGSGKAFKEKAL